MRKVPSISGYVKDKSAVVIYTLFFPSRTLWIQQFLRIEKNLKCFRAFQRILNDQPSQIWTFYIWELRLYVTGLRKKIKQKFVWLKVASINISRSTVSDRYDNVTLSPLVLGEGYDLVPFNVMEQRLEWFKPGGFFSPLRWSGWKN